MDADENPVLRLPDRFSRNALHPGAEADPDPRGPRLQQDETPGADFVTGMTDLFADSPAFRAVAGGLVGRSGPGLPDYRNRRVFQPDLKLRGHAWD